MCPEGATLQTTGCMCQTGTTAVKHPCCTSSDNPPIPPPVFACTSCTAATSQSDRRERRGGPSDTCSAPDSESESECKCDYEQKGASCVSGEENFINTCDGCDCGCAEGADSDCDNPNCCEGGKDDDICNYDGTCQGSLETVSNCEDCYCGDGVCDDATEYIFGDSSYCIDCSDGIPFCADCPGDCMEKGCAQ